MMAQYRNRPIPRNVVEAARQVSERDHKAALDRAELEFMGFAHVEDENARVGPTAPVQFAHVYVEPVARHRRLLELESRARLDAGQSRSRGVEQHSYARRGGK